MSVPVDDALDGFGAVEVLAGTLSSDLYLTRSGPWGHASVVVKVLRSTVDDDERRLFVEGNALTAGYGHPNLIEVLGAGALRDGRPWMAMPHHRRGSLADASSLSLEVVLRIGVRVADVLDLLHASGVLHRDVKPENILLGDDGEPVLSDLNTAGRRHQHTGSLTTGRVTRDYAAPEVLALGRYDVRSEIYSLGVTLAGLGDEVPPAFGALLARMTSAEPDLRPSSCAEVATRLRDLERAEDLPVTPPAAPLEHRDSATTMDPLPRDRRARRGRAGRRGPARRRWPLVITGAAVVTAASIAAATLVGGPTPSGGTSSGSTASALPSVSEQPVLREDFTDDLLNPAVWTPPSQPDHVYARERSLNLIGTNGPDQVVDTDLKPRDIGTFRELDVVIGATSAATPGSGGGAIVVTEQGGRSHKLAFGPSPGETTLLGAALVCRRVACPSYDDYVPPPMTRAFERFTVGEKVPVRILSDGKELTFWMRDVLMASTPIDQPLVGFAFSAYAEAPEQWHLTVDALRVYR